MQPNRFFSPPRIACSFIICSPWCHKMYSTYIARNIVCLLQLSSKSPDYDFCWLILEQMNKILKNCYQIVHKKNRVSSEFYLCCAAWNNTHYKVHINGNQAHSAGIRQKGCSSWPQTAHGRFWRRDFNGMVSSKPVVQRLFNSNQRSGNDAGVVCSSWSRRKQWWNELSWLSKAARRRRTNASENKSRCQKIPWGRSMVDLGRRFRIFVAQNCKDSQSVVGSVSKTQTSDANKQSAKLVVLKHLHFFVGQNTIEFYFETLHKEEDDLVTTKMLPHPKTSQLRSFLKTQLGQTNSKIWKKFNNTSAWENWRFVHRFSFQARGWKVWMKGEKNGSHLRGFWLQFFRFRFVSASSTLWLSMHLKLNCSDY